MGLDDVFRDPPEWDTDSSDSDSSLPPRNMQAENGGAALPELPPTQLETIPEEQDLSGRQSESSVQQVSPQPRRRGRITPRRVPNGIARPRSRTPPRVETNSPPPARASSPPRPTHFIDYVALAEQAHRERDPIGYELMLQERKNSPAKPKVTFPLPRPSEVRAAREARERAELLLPRPAGPTIDYDWLLSGNTENQGTCPSTLQAAGSSRAATESTTLDRSALPQESNKAHRAKQAGASRALPFVPRRLVDIENGRPLPDYDEHDGYDGALVTTEKPLPPMSERVPTYFNSSARSLQDKMIDGRVNDFQANDEAGFIGGAWRGVLKRLIMWCYDDINALRLSRQIQLFMPFHTGYEAYVLGQLVEALECGCRKDIRYMLDVAFQNRNVSRILVQLLGPRYDFLWHWSTTISWNRPFDAWGQLPLVGFTAFPATENFPNTRNHALTSIARVLLGQGNWLTRVVTGREGLITDDPHATAQNLAAESNGFELANRNQYGTHVGRRKTNEFRLLHRLPTDESLVRSFVTVPMPTMLNNGVVHVLRQLANHWGKTLSQQNFAHQRMEQLNPFETLRFHMPVVLLTLSSLRGRNKWDSTVLGRVTKRLQELKPSATVETAQRLVQELKDSVVMNVSGGSAVIIDPFQTWLDAIRASLDMIEAEAKEVHAIVNSVETGILLGHDLVTQMSWKIPNDSDLKAAILNHILGQDVGDVSERRIRTALELITPRDKRTLIELVKNGYESSRPAQLLLGRATTLLQRELRRDVLNEMIRHLSKGRIVIKPEGAGEWYWLEFGRKGDADVYVLDGKVMGTSAHRFLHLETRAAKIVNLSEETVTCRAYVPVGEAISRAQKVFMEIELDHGKKFAYNAFMEFSHLREQLRRLIVISQVSCEALDNARLMLLLEVQRAGPCAQEVCDLEPGKTYWSWSPTRKLYRPFMCRQHAPHVPDWIEPSRQKIVNAPPQSMIVVGGGPTGLLTAMHCTEAVLASGGVVKLYEARDAFAKGSAAFERSQIVRLDARWIAMLRYHLGTGFEDVFIPASGETDSQLGNTLPTQGFVEITIKDLEQMLHVEVSKMWSLGLLFVQAGSRGDNDGKSGSLYKLGKHLKEGDDILHHVDKEGRPSGRSERWSVVEVVELLTLGPEDLVIGESYGIYSGLEHGVVRRKLVGIDLRTNSYTFSASGGRNDELQFTIGNWPTIYPVGAGTHGDVHSVIVECKFANKSGGYVRETLLMESIREQKFQIDLLHTHVVEAAGKPHGSKVHFQVTTEEPYGTCCAQGLKISLGMHNFGQRRWKSGIIDDIRSQTDQQNTRIIGDFSKMCRSLPIVQKMQEFMTDKKDRNWQMHFTALVADSSLSGMLAPEDVVPKMQQACAELVSAAPTFRRQTLQTRFFETGDNYYLGMELMREYDSWKNDLATSLVEPLRPCAADSATQAKIAKLRGTIMHHIDRLWYDGVLEVIRTGDVYNPGARHRVPRLYLINSHVDEKLGTFPVGESFRLSESPKEKYEVLLKRPLEVIVRNVEGYVSKLPRSTLVRREGNLTRSPDGNAESTVALATFPVAHYVNHRTMRCSQFGQIFAFVGDEQATPHFMRYSGLTGACINAMLFNNFIKQANAGVHFIDRCREYSIETNWSNGEVVQRGTGGNYGEDGFLRPGFSYECVVNYLHSQMKECCELEEDNKLALSGSWKDKLAAALVPRGMEFNPDYERALKIHLLKQVVDTLISEIGKENSILNKSSLQTALANRFIVITREREFEDEESFWDLLLSSPDIDLPRNDDLIVQAEQLSQLCSSIVSHAKEAYLYNRRISSELSNQPKPVDSIVDDFAVEAQNFATSLTQSAAFASGTLAFKLVGETVATVFSEILAVLNIGISFGTMTNAARYKIRNEEARVAFADEKMLGVKQGVFAAMHRMQQDAVAIEEHPFAVCLEQQVSIFLKNVQYYNLQEPTEFLSDFTKLKRCINDPAEILFFMDLLTTKDIVDTYHVNSYAQESLVEIYKTLDGMFRLLTAPASTVGATDEDTEAWELFLRLNDFESKLENTLQRGATRFGFIKSRKFLQWDCFVVPKYLYRLLCCASRLCILPTAPISTRTLSIVRNAKHLSKKHGSKILHREIRDLETLHWATRESDIASTVFLSAFLVFVSSIVFTVAFIFRITVLTKLAFWLTLISSFGAILGSHHLMRKLVKLVFLAATLHSKVRAAPADERRNLRKVFNVTIAQIFLTATRLLSAGAAAVALPWSVANKAFENDIVKYTQVPFILALGSVCAAVFATLFFFLVEFVVRYNLSPRLGEFICESFRAEIEEMYARFALPPNDIDTKEEQERETWEYVAREFLHHYRFDAVFAADRFGSILQYVQGGMDRRRL